MYSLLCPDQLGSALMPTVRPRLGPAGGAGSPGRPAARLTRWRPLHFVRLRRRPPNLSCGSFPAQGAGGWGGLTRDSVEGLFVFGVILKKLILFTGILLLETEALN